MELLFHLSTLSTQHSKDYGRCCVCMCVCLLCHISHLELLFVLKMLQYTQQAMEVTTIVVFSLNLIHCRD